MSWKDECLAVFDDLLRQFGEPAEMVVGGDAPCFGKVLFQMPTADILGDMQLSSDYSIEYNPAHFPGLRHGAEITVGGVTYTVREVRDADDGFTKTATLKA